MSYKEKDVVVDVRRPVRVQVTLDKSFDFSDRQSLHL